MLERQMLNPSSSVIVRCKLRRADTGQGLTGLTSASSGLIISTICDNEAAATTYTVAGSTIETIATLGTYAAPTATKCRFKEVDATNHPGTYEIQLADARWQVASATTMRISILGATNLLERELLFQLVAYNPNDAVRLGLTAFANISVVTGAVATDAGNSTTQIKTTLTNAQDDVYNDSLIVLTSGDLAGCVKKVTDYVGSSKTIVCGAFPSIPADAVTFVLINK